MKNMHKVLAGLMATGLLLTGCSTSSTKTTGSADNGTAATDTGYDASWYKGPGYDKLKEELGKADVDLSAADGKLKEIIEKGKITMATSPDYPPSEFVDTQGNVKGSDVLLGQYIANSLGVELEVETMDFNAVLTAVDTGKADMGISGFGYKKDRAEQFELSVGYQSNSSAAHHTLLVPADKVDEYKSLSDFDGKKIDAQANSLQEMYVNDQIKDADLQLVSTLDQAILELQTGKIDAIALDSTTAKNYADTSDGMFASVLVANGVEFDLSQYEDTAGNVVAVKKGETSLIDAINTIVKSLPTSGKYEENLYTDMYYAACVEAEVSPNEE